MNGSNDNIRVVIPLSIRRRNGRPKILPPEDMAAGEVRAQDPHILKALGRAWAWRRKLESGVVATAGELAAMEGVTERFISRTVRLAYLAPDVVGAMVTHRFPTALSMNKLMEIPIQPWRDQPRLVFVGAASGEAFRELRRTGRKAIGCGS